MMVSPTIVGRDPVTGFFFNQHDVAVHLLGSPTLIVLNDMAWRFS